METRRNNTRNNLYRMKNGNENIQENEQRSHAAKSQGNNLHRNKRVPLGVLSNACDPIQTRSKV